MPTLFDVDPSLAFAMFKGEPGTRKSTHALSYPGPQYWFSWDRKMNGIIVPCMKWGINPRLHVEYDDYDNWSKAEAKLKQFQVNCRFKTIIVDSLTSCADMTLYQTVSSKAGTTRKSGAEAGKQIAGISVNETEDYNAESSALQQLIYFLKDIQSYHKCNVILIAHVVQAEYRNTITNVTHVSRTIVTAGKKVAPKIPAYCNEVYHFNIKKGFNADEGGQYSLLTEHTGDDFARTALDLPKEIIFNDKPLYSNWIEPAIKKIQGIMRPNVSNDSTVVSQPTKGFGVD